MLALARTHTYGRVALEQLAAVKALARGVLEILDLQVLVEVDEVLALRVVHDRKRMRHHFPLGQRRHSAGVAVTTVRGRRRPGAHAVRETRLERVTAVDLAAGEQAVR